ncbi:hypothetical protein SGLAM104S_08053 [Streptomyces glaucescens]
MLDANLVVAADGVNSRLRARLFPHHPGPAYSGSTVLRAITERPVDLADDFSLTWGRGAEFGHIAFTDGRAEWHAVLTSPPGIRHAAPLHALRRRFEGWHDPISPPCSTRPGPRPSSTTTCTNWPPPCPPSSPAGSPSSATRPTP